VFILWRSILVESIVAPRYINPPSCRPHQGRVFISILLHVSILTMCGMYALSTGSGRGQSQEPILVNYNLDRNERTLEFTLQMPKWERNYNCNVHLSPNQPKGTAIRDCKVQGGILNRTMNNLTNSHPAPYYVLTSTKCESS